jgi:hypothetical protein
MLTVEETEGVVTKLYLLEFLDVILIIGLLSILKEYFEAVS